MQNLIAFPKRTGWFGYYYSLPKQATAPKLTQFYVGAVLTTILPSFLLYQVDGSLPPFLIFLGIEAIGAVIGVAMFETRTLIFPSIISADRGIEIRETLGTRKAA
jgi:hypothetical protein